jgi:hypothetical protein
MSGELAVIERPLSAIQMREQVNLIQEVMKEVMQEGQHYGLIPGCGDKPSLLKPGAEKLMFTFRLVPDPEVEVFDLYHQTIAGHREYRVKVKIYSRGGEYMGGGVGSCSTMEGKYRFRGGEKTGTGKPLPKAYWNLRNEGKIAEAQELIGGHGFSHGKIDGAWEICEIGEKMEHDNPADFYNTCEKMAKKRALVDATLTVTAASDIFTQDIEEMVEVLPGAKAAAEGKKETKSAKEPIKEPQKKSAPGANTATITIKEIAEQTKTKDDKPMKNVLFHVWSEDGVDYRTFDKKMAEAASSAIGKLVTVTFEKNQYGIDLKTLEPAEVKTEEREPGAEG